MNRNDNGQAEPPQGRQLDLSEAELEVLSRACQRYRAAIPTYLKSREEERALLDRLLEKIASRRSSSD